LADIDVLEDAFEMLGKPFVYSFINRGFYYFIPIYKIDFNKSNNCCYLITDSDYNGFFYIDLNVYRLKLLNNPPMIRKGEKILRCYSFVSSKDKNIFYIYWSSSKKTHTIN
jgi:hypothetical protein